MNNNSQLRRIVFKRDKGICAHCGLDCVKLKREWLALSPDVRDYLHYLIPINITYGYWQVDHIVSQYDGGSDDLSNLQTLCVSCHATKTSESKCARTKVVARDPTTQRAVIGTLLTCLNDPPFLDVVNNLRRSSGMPLLTLDGIRQVLSAGGVFEPTTEPCKVSDRFRVAAGSKAGVRRTKESK